MTVRNYSNAAKPIALSSNVSSVDALWPVATTAGYPDPPFTVCIERGTADEEFSLCTAKDAVSFTVDRGFDGATPISHLAGSAIEHVVGDIDYREANLHVNDRLIHPTICTSTTRPASPQIGQSIFETDTRMPMRYVGAGVWTTDRAIERWWTSSLDNLTANSITTFFNSGAWLANSNLSGWPATGTSTTGALTFPFLMVVQVFGHVGFSVGPCGLDFYIDSPEGTGIWQPQNTGEQITSIPHNAAWFNMTQQGFKIFWTGGTPMFSLRYDVQPPGSNVYFRLAIRASVVPVF